MSPEVVFKFVLSLKAFGTLVACKFYFFKVRFVVSSIVGLGDKFPTYLAQHIIHFEVTVVEKVQAQGLGTLTRI